MGNKTSSSYTATNSVQYVGYCTGQLSLSMPALQFTYFKQTVRALSGGDEEVFKQWHQEFFPLSTKIERNWQGESTVFTTA